jgi:hypothetical protein
MSLNNHIKQLCDNWNPRLNILYVKNEHNRGSSSANLNNGIKKATGEYIKIIFQGQKEEILFK